MNNFDPASNFQGKANAVIIRFAAELNAKPLIAPPSNWWAGRAMERSGASIITRFYIPVHSFKPTPWTGAAKFSGISNVFFDVTRNVKDFGVAELAQKIAEMDFGAFNLSPTSMATAAGKTPQTNFADLLNVGYVTPDWTGTNFFRKTATKPNCPGKPSLGKFLNAFENAAMVTSFIKTAIQNVQSRKGFDGLTLGLRAMELWAPTEHFEAAQDICEVFQLAPTTYDGATGGGNTQLAYRRLKPVEVPGLREDMWIVAAIPSEEHLKPFAYVKGGEVGVYQANEDPMKSGAGVPHIEVTVFSTDSEMYKSRRMLGVNMLINEGFSLATPHTLCANFTGAAS